MLYFSTEGRAGSVPFRKALFDGLAPDGGLYMPAEIPDLGSEFFQTVASSSYPELASRMILPFVKEDIPESKLNDICESAFNFDLPLIGLDERIGMLELFHGPTLAFKDFAARFMARVMEYFLQGEEKELTVLVATSGDTGGAVANGFQGIEGIRVVILYPSGRVSRIQEQQMTTLGGNITALEVNGSFDDCQRLVKKVFQDKELRKSRAYSSANSINIARLLPQTVYYAWALHLAGSDQPVVFSVPSGNFGNLTAGLIARRMGLPVEKFCAATNANDVFPAYLEAGEYNPQRSRQTISNAMDVGNPSNLERIQNLYDGDVSAIKDDIVSWSFSDDETKTAIRESYEKYGYLADPHTAVAILGMEKYFRESDSKAKGIVLSTAHPGKFPDVISLIVTDEQPVPEELKIPLRKEKHSIPLSDKYDDFKEYLLSR